MNIRLVIPVALAITAIGLVILLAYFLAVIAAFLFLVGASA